MVLWAGKKYNCKGWTLTPPDLASNPSEHSLTSNLQAPWLTQEIVAAALTASRRCSLQHRLSDIWWKSRNENTMESLTLGNHAVSTAGHHSPWIWVFRRQNDDKPTGNHLDIWNSGSTLQRIPWTHTLTSRFPSDFFPFSLFSLGDHSGLAWQTL